MEGKRLIVIGAGNSGLHSSPPISQGTRLALAYASQFYQSLCMLADLECRHAYIAHLATGKVNMKQMPVRDSECVHGTRHGHRERGVTVRGCSGVPVLPEAGACGAPVHFWHPLRLHPARVAGHHSASQAAGGWRHLPDQALTRLPSQLQISPAQIWPAAGALLCCFPRGIYEEILRFFFTCPCFIR